MPGLFFSWILKLARMFHNSRKDHAVDLISQGIHLMERCINGRGRLKTSLSGVDLNHRRLVR